jgi:hypothetical protein
MRRHSLGSHEEQDEQEQEQEQEKEQDDSERLAFGGDTQEKKRKREGSTRGKNTDVRDIDFFLNEISNMGKELPVVRKEYKGGRKEAPSTYLARLRDQFNRLQYNKKLEENDPKK